MAINFNMSCENIEQAVLTKLLESLTIADTWDFSFELQIDHQVLVGAMKSLMVDNYVTSEPLSTTYWSLTDEGRQICLEGSPEYLVFNAIPSEGGITVGNLSNKVGDSLCKIGLAQCMKNKLVKKDGECIVKITENINDETAELLRQVENGNLSDKILQDLKKRKLAQQIIRKSYKVSFLF